jgi:hypothetical protein
MSSISSPAVSRIVAARERLLLSTGRIAEDNSSAFAVRPAVAAQDPEPDAPQPGDPVVIAVDAARAGAANEPPSPAAGYVAAAQAAQAAPPDADTANEALAPASYAAATASQAAYTYAQTMRAWLESRPPRTVPARRLPKPKGRPGR